MSSNKFTWVVLTIAVSVLGLAQRGLAVPQLQLDVIGGTYDEATETIIAPAGDMIQLVALFTPNGNPSDEEIAAMLGQTFHLSSALIGTNGEGGDFGSFDIDGHSVEATGDMVFGVPPMELPEGNQDQDPGDLPTHGIFDAYFYELAFQFASGNTALTYDTQDNPGGLVPSESGETFYQIFTVDTSNLAEGAQLHFDLYTTNHDGGFAQLSRPVNENDIDRVLFAPFSHDASTNRLMPEPTTVWLLAVGFLGLGLARRRQR